MDAYIGLADTYLAMGNPEEAKKVLEEAENAITSEHMDEKTETDLKRIREKQEETERILETAITFDLEPTPTPEPSQTPTPEPTALPDPITPEPSVDAGAIDWNDIALEQAMRDVMGITDRIITKEDVEKITELNLSGKSIQNIEALKYMSQLNVLDLSNNEITDIRVIAELTELRELHLDGNKISNFDVLLGLDKLEVIYLDSDGAFDYSTLSQLTGLKELYVNGINIMSEPTPTPEPISETDPTTIPEVTAKPETTVTPEPTAIPETTAMPEITPTPKPTATSEPTPTLEPTATPEPTVTSKATPTPEATVTLELTPTLEPTIISEPTPEPTATPEPTPTPEPTEEPEPDVSDLGIVELEDAEIGDTVVFGHYEQDNDTSNGKEAIEWIVLDEDGDKLFLLSKDALDCKRYQEEDYMDDIWEISTLRTWLNENFYKAAFSKEEQGKIETTHLNNKSDSGDTWSKATDDKIFLLSGSEATTYFSSDKYKHDLERQAKASEYAKAQGAMINTSEEYYDNCTWWLRTTSSNGGIYSIDFYGSFEAVDANIRGRAIRPAIWVNRSSD